MVARSSLIADARSRLGPSACPGLFRIVPARDGGICRLKIPLGQMSSAQARALGKLASRFGSNVIDVTNRANLQLRGIARDSEEPLIGGLLGAGLGPAQPEADDIRNIMVSPTAGIDPGQSLDAVPLARDLLAFLETDQSCRALTPKFSFLVDGGEDVAVVDHPHDIWLASLDDGAHMALGFAGSPPTEGGTATAFVIVPTRRALDAVRAALAIFLEAAASGRDIVRFRDLLGQMPANSVCGVLAEKLGRDSCQHGAASAWGRRRPRALGHVGIGRQRQAGLAYVGALPPVGRLSGDQMVQIADIVEAAGGDALRLTPWQGLLLPNLPEPRASRTVVELERLGLVCNPAQPLASIVACSGQTGCSSGQADTKADAVALAAQLAAEGISAPVHLTGCEKSCASARVAEATLLASGNGRYGLYLKTGGSGRFGALAAADVTIAEAAHHLAGLRQKTE